MEMEPRLDHVVVNVRNELPAAAARFAALGFTLTAPSHHTLGSMNRLALFPNHYLELLGIDPDAKKPRAELMRSPRGLNAIVFATDDAASLHRDLAARGVPVEPPIDFSRAVAGLGEARFRTVHVAAHAVPFGRLYFCQHFTKAVVWGAAAHEHANGANSIARIVIEARDPAAAEALFRGLFPGADVARSGIAIEKASADRIAGLVFRTRSLAAARAALAGVPIRDEGERLEVAPEAAFGAQLVFIE